LEQDKVSPVTFVVSWILLIVLTAALLKIAGSGMAATPKTFAILAMMTLQAYLVAFYFMHLRFERLPLVLSVLLGLMATTGLLYALIIWDGSRIVRLVVGP